MVSTREYGSPQPSRASLLDSPSLCRHNPLSTNRIGPNCSLAAWGGALDTWAGHLGLAPNAEMVSHFGPRKTGRSGTLPDSESLPPDWPPTLTTSDVAGDGNQPWRTNGAPSGHWPGNGKARAGLIQPSRTPRVKCWAPRTLRSAR